MKAKNKVDMEEVKTFISEVERTKEYDGEQISQLHDQIFGKDERRGSGEPCPIMQMRKIKAWYQDEKRK